MIAPPAWLLGRLRGFVALAAGGVVVAAIAGLTVGAMVEAWWLP